MDFSAAFALEHERLKYSSAVKAGMNYSVANEADALESITMLYSPLLIASWKNSLVVGMLDIEVTYCYTSERHYSDERMLDPYNLADIRAGVNIPAGKGKVGIHITCNNVTNTTYELIRLYPMPGRYWSAKIDYEF
jgi:hypothetical protein